MQLLKWVQAEFPALHPGGVTDSKPLMAPVEQRLNPRDETRDVTTLAAMDE